MRRVVCVQKTVVVEPASVEFGRSGRIHHGGFVCWGATRHKGATMTLQEALREAFELGIDYQKHLACQTTEEQQQNLQEYTAAELSQIDQGSLASNTVPEPPDLSKQDQKGLETHLHKVTVIFVV